MDLLRVDEFVMLLIAAALVVIIQRDHGHASFIIRVVFYATSFFGLCLFWRDLSLGREIPPNFYWARVGFDTCVAILLIARVFFPGSVPRLLTPAAKRSPIRGAVHSDRDPTGVNHT